MRKHCGNCANHRNETNAFSEECGKCVQAVLENGEKTAPSHWREKPQTNADRIRAMSDEELAKSLSKTVVDAICYSHGTEKTVDKLPKEIWDDLVKEYLEWLKQPADMRGADNA